MRIYRYLSEYLYICLKINFIVKLERDNVTPILEPDNKEVGAIFNAGVTSGYDGKIHILPRVVPNGYKKGGKYISYIGHLSGDGSNFLGPIEQFIVPNSAIDHLGCEDARVTRLDGEYFITYTAISEKGARIALASTKDFSSVKKHGIISPPDICDKNAVIFPERIDGKLAMLHRIEPNIQIVKFDEFSDLHDDNFWKEYCENLEEHIVMMPEYEWESVKIGAGPPPIRTDNGWLLIYHGVSMLPNSEFVKYDGNIHNKIYRAGATLLDIGNPRKVIGRSKEPILEPLEEYEKCGDVPNVVFPQGLIVVGKKLLIYYGAADSSCHVARCCLDDLVDSLIE